MVTVTLRETYDLSTKPSKMTLIGVHTPTSNIISRLYPGFCVQYKMCRILHQNVRVQSASRLPVDPAGIGYASEGQVSPEDMFNPILYKACSNESLTNLEYRIRGLSESVLTSVNGESVVASNENVSFFDDEFNIYYSLLSNTHGWRVAHPQAGLQMTRLRPLVFEKWYNEGVNSEMANYVVTNPSGGTLIGNMPSDAIPVDKSTAEENSIGSMMTMSMRGSAHPMPAFNTKYLTAVRDGSQVVSGTGSANGMNASSGSGQPSNAMAKMPQLPQIYTAVIVVPPSRNTILYYRMVVETVVEFSGIQSMDEITTLYNLNNRDMFPVYWRDYTVDNPETKMVVSEDTVTVSEGADLKKIMES